MKKMTIDAIINKLKQKCYCSDINYTKNNFYTRRKYINGNIKKTNLFFDIIIDNDDSFFLSISYVKEHFKRHIVSKDFKNINRLFYFLNTQNNNLVYISNTLNNLDAFMKKVFRIKENDE